MLNWFAARESTEIGIALADRLAPRLPAKDARRVLEELLAAVRREARLRKLNLFKRAKFAQSFKWRLIEKGVARPLADDLTDTLLLQLSLPGAADGSPNWTPVARLPPRRDPKRAEELLGKGGQCLRNGAYGEAERHWREALSLNPKDARLHQEIGNLLRLRGEYDAAEAALRKALALGAASADAKINLGATLVGAARLPAASALYEQVLKADGRNVDALVGLAQIAEAEGRFQDVETLLQRGRKLEPRNPGILIGLIHQRRMGAEDRVLLERALEIAASGLDGYLEGSLRFAIGKFHDDVGDYRSAFESYRRANALFRALATPYDRDARRRFVDGRLRGYGAARIAGPAAGSSDSAKPVLVLGMMRSGTSLAEQILASHAAVRGAGELPFWSVAARTHETELRDGPPGAELRRKLADAYLRVLDGHSAGARHVIDKAPVNVDHLGLIHAVFPNARIIYLQRDPIDVCLSCYFQRFSPSLNFTMDLSDLAHYYREHRRLMRHWRRVLPPGTLLEVPYAGLVCDPEGWTRRMLGFLGLEWDEHCRNFHETRRTVLTASAWQVRQKVYSSSIERWRHYEDFIEPLLDLKDARET
jgi:tetratricopeptide (TPR) repeat protein